MPFDPTSVRLNQDSVDMQFNESMMAGDSMLKMKAKKKAELSRKSSEHRLGDESLHEPVSDYIKV